MNATAHAASASMSVPGRSLGELLAAAAACTLLWSWPEIAFPARAIDGLVFGIVMGVPTGVALWAAFKLAEAAMDRAIRTNRVPRGR